VPPKSGGEDDRYEGPVTSSCTTFTFTPVMAAADSVCAFAYLHPVKMRWTITVYDMDTDSPSGRLITSFDDTGPFGASMQSRADVARLCAHLVEWFARGSDRNV